MNPTATILWLATVAIATAADLANPAHPRLWLPESALPALRETLAKDPLAAQLQSATLAEAERILTARTCRYDIPDGKRLLGESRLALHHVMHSAWAWRTGGGEKFRLRTIAELDAACALKDWNPSHFLDTAEMATAVATGYDWLYPTLTPDQRSRYEQAIVSKALRPAKAVFDQGGWWAKPKNNWAQVCGSGIALAAAAVAGHDEGLAEELFTCGLTLVESCGKFYQPDGMYPEGPGYWQFGTNYHVMLLAACGPLGRPLTADPILRQAGAAIMHLTSPTRLTYNFADGGTGHAVSSAAQCWLASQFQDAAQAQHVRDLFRRTLADGKDKVASDRCFPLAIAWLPPAPPAATPLPTAAVFHGEQAMALFRSGWEPKAAYLAIKGGTPAASHGHMDVGSFIYDAHGQRWLHDLGAEDYNLPAYFGSQRWTYYRLQNRSHNTLEIAGQLQVAKAAPAPLTASSLTGNSLSASFDLSAAYAGAATKVERTAHFDAASGTARIEDAVTQPTGDVVWRAFTDAAVEITGDRVILRKKGGEISLRRLSNSGVWSVAAATPPTAAEKQNTDFRAIVLTVPAAEQVEVNVEIRP